MIRSAHLAARSPTGVNVPLFWPMLAAAQMTKEGIELYAKNLKFLDEEGWKSKLDTGFFGQGE